MLKHFGFKESDEEQEESIIFPKSVINHVNSPDPTVHQNNVKYDLCCDRAALKTVSTHLGGKTALVASGRLCHDISGCLLQEK